MMNKEFRFTVLCEDQAHFNFVSGYLRSKGVSSRKIFANTPPPGVDSAEKYVRDHFLEEVEAYRKWARERIALIVVTDADQYAYDKRLKMLLSTLEKPLSKDERVVILIPAKNIETWFRYADNSLECDEETDYKSKYKSASPSACGKKYAEDICPNLPPDAPAALQKARMEVERVKGLRS